MKQFAYNLVKELDFWCGESFPGGWFQRFANENKWNGKQI